MYPLLLITSFNGSDFLSHFWKSTNWWWLMRFSILILLGTQCNLFKAFKRAVVRWNWSGWCCTHIYRQQGNRCSGSSRRTGIAFSNLVKFALLLVLYFSVSWFSFIYYMQFNIQRISFDEGHSVETLEEAKAALWKLIKKGPVHNLQK